MRAPASSNSTYRLTPQQRAELGVLAWMELWPKAQLAAVFGVSARTVVVCRERWEASVCDG